MSVAGVRIGSAAAGRAPLSSRADVAFVVGEVARRETGSPPPRETPVLFTSFAAFERVFAWEKRPIAFMPGAMVATTLGLAVRSFFAEGGRACHVLRVGDPEPMAGPDMLQPAGTEPENRERWLKRRVRRLESLIASAAPRADEPARWTGVAHLLGLPDVALLLIPDLPDVFAAPPAVVAMAEPRQPPEVFRPLAMPVPAVGRPPRRRLPIAAPRLDAASMKAWAEAVARVSQMLSARGDGRRDVTFIAALPLAAPLGAPSAEALAIENLLEAGGACDGLQLVHPWAATDASAGQPEGIEPPDGLVAGVIARSSLARGGFRSAAGLDLVGVHHLATATGGRDLQATPDRQRLSDPITRLALRREGHVLASDVTVGGGRFSGGTPAGLRRLKGILLRAARAVGEDLLFEPSVEATWTRLRRRLETMLAELLALGAFAGETPADAFQVRCDRSTMTQADMDAGRLIAVVSFIAAQPIERIVVTLDVQTGRAGAVRSDVGRAA